MARLLKEVEALRVVAPLLNVEAEDSRQPTTAGSAAEQLIEEFQVNNTPQQTRAAWGERAKNWLRR